MKDSAYSDITQLRCLSYDEHPIINENATLYEGVYVEKPKHKSFPTCFIYEGENTSAEVAVCCRKIQQCGIDITASYDDWLKVGCALARVKDHYSIFAAGKTQSTMLQRRTRCLPISFGGTINRSISARSFGCANNMA